ncbi:MAG: DUF3857 domain-containing protein [Candidatus Eisenbacteria bacterium]|uniref:DUF3857 domain-containing protein n=1 Tax=Eiseniibacteriota bacterium TaxID=2212470 RepID=A0A956LZF9_UNCEI|nr:DUF3857 domain-containing protein [Candidatus Eisenbacteria bacterium]
MRIRVRAGGEILLAAICMIATIALSPARAFEPDEVKAIVRNPASAETYPGAGGVWLAIERRIEIDGAGNLHGFDHRIARVLDSDWGAEHFSPYVRTYAGEYQSVRILVARVWQSVEKFEDLPPDAVRHLPSAKTEDAAPYAKIVDLTAEFPQLEPGSTVEVLTEYYERTRPGDLNVRSFEYLFGAEEPVVEQQLHLSHPAAFDPAMESLGDSLFFQPKRLGSGRSFDWLTGRLSAQGFRVEDALTSRSPAPESALPEDTRLTVYAGSVWEYLSGYYGRNWDREIGSGDPDITLGVGDIVGDVTGADARVDAIENWVQTEVRTLRLTHQLLGMTPIAPGEIYRAHAGAPRDKAALMIALLAAVGIRGEPVLVRTRTGPWLRDLAAPEQLDRFLVRVFLPGGGERWCDPVESETPLPPSEGLNILMEGSDERGLIPFPGRAGR